MCVCEQSRLLVDVYRAILILLEPQNMLKFEIWFFKLKKYILSISHFFPIAVSICILLKIKNLSFPEILTRDTQENNHPVGCSCSHNEQQWSSEICPSVRLGCFFCHRTIVNIGGIFVIVIVLYTYILDDSCSRVVLLLLYYLQRIFYVYYNLYVFRGCIITRRTVG